MSSPPKFYSCGSTKSQCYVLDRDVVIFDLCHIWMVHVIKCCVFIFLFSLQGKNPLQKVNWLRLVLDEGHTVRNPKTLMTKAVLALNAERKWVVTGELKHDAVECWLDTKMSQQAVVCRCVRRILPKSW